MSAKEKEEKRDKKSKKKIVGIVIGIVLIVVVGLCLLANFLVPRTSEIEESEIFNADEVEIKSMAVIFALNAEDYDTLQTEYANEEMKSFLTKETIDEAKKTIDADWDGAVSFGAAEVMEVRQMGKTYATVQFPVSYGEDTVTYTLSFDEEYKLAGLYMK